MFLNKYVNDLYLDLIFSRYNNDFINILDEENFFEVYNLFSTLGFNYIDDIILNYLEIFDMDVKDVNKALNNLKILLGDNYIDIISKNLTYLDKIFDFV